MPSEVIAPVDGVVPLNDACLAGMPGVGYSPPSSLALTG